MMGRIGRGRDRGQHEADQHPEHYGFHEVRRENAAG